MDRSSSGCFCPFVLPLIFALVMASCAGAKRSSSDAPGSAGAPRSRADLEVIPQGQIEGRNVAIYRLRNVNGMEVELSDLGGAILSIRVPDRAGRFDNVVRGYDDLASYATNSGMFGTLVGRFANRIGNARFTLDGRTHQLAANERDNAIHGGPRGFHKAVWKAEPVLQPHARGVQLAHESPDGDEGYPGKLTVRVRYLLTDDNELRIEYEASTDRPTVINLTNHAYFNLAGQVEATVLDHVMTINALAFTPVDEELIPTGELRSVKDTPFDFTQPTPIGARIDQDDPQLRFGKGYDHNYVLADAPRQEPQLAGRVVHPASGPAVVACAIPGAAPSCWRHNTFPIPPTTRTSLLPNCARGKRIAR